MDNEDILINKISYIYNEIKQTISEQKDEVNHIDIDFIKSGFVEINEQMSLLKNRQYYAKFEGNWYDCCQNDLIKMLIKLRKEVNNRYGFEIIHEEENNNPFHENYYKIETNEQNSQKKNGKRTKSNKENNL